MKVKPASVHFLANTGFSLNYILVSFILTRSLCQDSYKAIPWMYALTSLLLCNLYYSVSIEICGRVTKVHSIRGAQGML
jgi:hypothetical protein